MATRRENSENHLRLVREENETIQVRKVMLIFNPLRIRGQRYYRRNKERVITMFAESEIEVEEKPTERAGHAEDILRDTVLTGIDAVCILGGDGSLKEAVSGLITREDQCTIPIAIIPSGTGNNFAKDLNLFGVERAVQVWTVKSFMSFSSSSFMFPLLFYCSSSSFSKTETLISLHSIMIPL